MEETEAQRDEATCLGSHSQIAAEPKFEPKLMGFNILQPAGMAGGWDLNLCWSES